MKFDEKTQIADISPLVKLALEGIEWKPRMSLFVIFLNTEKIFSKVIVLVRLRSKALFLLQDDQFRDAFVLFYRFAIIVIKFIPQHPEFLSLRYCKSFQDLLSNVKIASGHLETIKLKIGFFHPSPDVHIENANTLIGSSITQPSSSIQEEVVDVIDETRNIDKKQPLTPSSIVPPNGFKNIGNNCYLNALLQCILSVSDTLLSGLKQDNRCTDIKNPKSLLGFEWFSTRKKNISPLVSSFTEFVYSKNSNLLAPLFSLQAALWRRWPHLGGGSQQDAHEVLLSLLNGLHEDLSEKPYSSDFQSYPSEFRISSFDGVESINLNADRAVSIFQSSPISVVFHSIIVTMIECLTCNIYSAIFTPNVIVSLDIPKHSCSLVECLEEYFVKEKLPNSWTCSSHFCTSSKLMENGAIKGLFFSKLPKILILNLKRFSFDNGEYLTMYNFRIARRARSNVSIPEFLDVSRWCVSVGAKKTSSPIQPTIFELMSVCVHKGNLDSIHSGHYIAVTRRSAKERKWFICNDEIVDEVGSLPGFIVHQPITHIN